jgi:hypothetical protein
MSYLNEDSCDEQPQGESQGQIKNNAKKSVGL